MPISRPGDFFNQKKIEEERILREQQEAKEAAVEEKRVKSPRRFLGESFTPEPLFKKREKTVRPTPIQEAIKKTPQPVVEEKDVVEESISYLNEELRTKANITSFIALQEEVSERADDIENRISNLDRNYKFYKLF